MTFGSGSTARPPLHPGVALPRENVMQKKETPLNLDGLYAEACRLLEVGTLEAGLPGAHNLPPNSARGVVASVVAYHSGHPALYGAEGWQNTPDIVFAWRDQLFKEVDGAQHLNLPKAWILQAFMPPQDHNRFWEDVRQLIRAFVACYLLKRLAEEKPDQLDWVDACFLEQPSS